MNLSDFNINLSPTSIGSRRKPLDFDAIRHAAQGNWVSVVFPSVGINLRGNGKKHQPCPVCSGTDRFRCDDKQGEGTYICSQCGSGNGFMLVQKYTGLDAYDTNKLIAECIGFDTSSSVSDKQRLEWQTQQVEREAAERADREQQRASAALRAENMWNNGKEVDKSHAYLVSKSITVPPSIKQLGCDLIIPMYQKEKLVNMQSITPSGDKLFLTGGLVKGAYHTIYDKSTLDFGILLLCEGYATGVTLFNASDGQYPVFVAFNANNLLPVAVSLREQYPSYRIIIAADDDDTTARKMMMKDITDGKIPKSFDEYNTGLREAKKAANAINGEIMMLRSKE